MSDTDLLKKIYEMEEPTHAAVATLIGEKDLKRLLATPYLYDGGDDDYVNLTVEGEELVNGSPLRPAVEEAAPSLDDLMAHSFGHIPPVDNTPGKTPTKMKYDEIVESEGAEAADRWLLKNATKHITEHAREILHDGDPLGYVIEQVGRMHIGDKNAAKILVLSTVVQKVANAKGFHPGLHGDSGKGKTDLCKAVRHVSPRGMVVETSLSPKALYYAAKPEYGIIVEGTTVVCDDLELTDDLRTTLKRSTTNFTEPTLHMTVINGAPAPLTIPPRVVWWLTSVDADDDEQVLNREIPLPVDDTKETDEAVFKRQLKLLRTGEPAMPEDDAIEVAREIMRIVKAEMCNVSVPYAIEGIITWDNKNNRRNFDVFGDVLKAIALMNKYQRKSIMGDVRTIEATLGDFDAAAEIYGAHGQAQATKLTEGEINILKYLAGADRPDHSATIDEIQKYIGKGRSRTYQILHGKDGQGGLLKKVPALMYLPESINTPVRDKEGKVVESRTKPHNIYKLDIVKFNPFDAYLKVVDRKKE